MTEIKYSSPAFPPYGLRVGKVYNFQKKDKVYIVSDFKNKFEMSLDEIKMLFTPVEKTWDEVLKTSKTTKKETE